ncbi:MAG TPA: helix-turn-helix transcriptional regulator [Streptosporangiaceae bacterium]
MILGVVYLTRGPSLAGQYLAVANPANHRLDVEVDGYTDAQHDDLAEARADLRAEVATERWFDTHLAAIKFPLHVAAISRDLIRINGQRAGMTALQAQSTSLTQMRSFNRQHAVALVAHGLSNDEIAGAMVLSPATAKTHVSRAMTKLGARDRAQLVVFAYQNSLVSPRSPRI